MAFTSVRPCHTLVSQRKAAVDRRIHAVTSSTSGQKLTSRLICRAQSQEHSAGTHFLNGVAAAASAAVLLLGPMTLSAQAVSGGTSVEGIGNPLSGKDYSGQDLHGKSYTKAVMRKTNFSNANLTGVSFFSALAEGSNFSGANMRFADLESGNFEDADFTNAVLEGAFVNNAQLKNAKITGTDWTDVVLRKDMQMYLCSIADGTNPVTGVDTRESLMCP